MGASGKGAGGDADADPGGSTAGVAEASPPAARIRELPIALANQIAAGEVVERPASVLKELLENSLDAGARRVEVDVEAAGVRLLRVRDDGAGIHRDDLRLALARHATSKLRTAADLARIASLGFRGEALPSIASVSRLSLAARLRGDENGWQVRCDGGADILGPEPVALTPGTTVEVRDLFYNIPARRKFLKTERTEAAHLEDVLRRLALTHFPVAFVYRHNRREVLSLRAATEDAGCGRRVAELCGAAFMEQALWLDQESEGLRLHGWVGMPDASRPQADLQFLTLNGRSVRDRLAAHALREAYQDWLAPGRYPAYVLYLGVDPEEVDVNVHPTKHEVRFREPRLVHDFILRSVRRGLAAVAGARTAGLPVVPGPAAAGAGSDAHLQGPLLGGAHGPVMPAAQAGGSAPARRAPATLAGGRAAIGLYGTPAAAVPGEGVADAADAGFLGRPLACLHQRYLLSQVPEGLVVLDLPRARALLMARALRQGAAAGAVPAKPVLLPVAVTLAEAAATRLQAAAPLLARLGLGVNVASAGRVLLLHVPELLQELEPAALLGSLARVLARSSPADREQAVLEALIGVLAEQVAAQPWSWDPVAANRLLRALEGLAPEGLQVGPGSIWLRIGVDELEAGLGAGSSAGPGHGPGDG